MASNDENMTLAGECRIVWVKRGVVVSDFRGESEVGVWHERIDLDCFYLDGRNTSFFGHSAIAVGCCHQLCWWRVSAIIVLADSYEPFYQHCWAVSH